MISDQETRSIVPHPQNENIFTKFAKQQHHYCPSLNGSTDGDINDILEYKNFEKSPNRSFQFNGTNIYDVNCSPTPSIAETTKLKNNSKDSKKRKRIICNKNDYNTESKIFKKKKSKKDKRNPCIAEPNQLYNTRDGIKEEEKYNTADDKTNLNTFFKNGKQQTFWFDCDDTQRKTNIFKVEPNWDIEEKLTTKNENSNYEKTENKNESKGIKDKQKFNKQQTEDDEYNEKHSKKNKIKKNGNTYTTDRYDFKFNNIEEINEDFNTSGVSFEEDLSLYDSIYNTVNESNIGKRKSSETLSDDGADIEFEIKHKNIKTLDDVIRTNKMNVKVFDLDDTRLSVLLNLKSHQNSTSIKCSKSRKRVNRSKNDGGKVLIDVNYSDSQKYKKHWTIGIKNVELPIEGDVKQEINDEEGPKETVLCKQEQIFDDSENPINNNQELSILQSQKDDRISCKEISEVANSSEENLKVCENEQENLLNVKSDLNKDPNDNVQYDHEIPSENCENNNNNKEDQQSIDTTKEVQNNTNNVLKEGEQSSEMDNEIDGYTADDIRNSRTQAEDQESLTSEDNQNGFVFNNIVTSEETCNNFSENDQQGGTSSVESDSISLEEQRKTTEIPINHQQEDPLDITTWSDPQGNPIGMGDPQSPKIGKHIHFIYS